ncbi:MAG: branched-chain amino acid ABC transporter permease [Desulfarculus sp.]|nr:MAG: branched-chain amino acid ABC transporter permease [Desulfarculus sp.]
MADQHPPQTPVQAQRAQEAAGRYTRAGLWLQVILLVLLALEPWLVSSFRVMDVAAKVMIFAVLVASYDLLLGYTGIFSLAHAMFFGLGAYSLALIIHHAGAPLWYHLPLAALLATGLAVLVSLVVAFFSLRLKALFFVVMTLALAQFADILSIQWHSLTRGEDGVSFKLPGLLDVGWSGGKLWGLTVNGRLLTYYIVLAAAALLFVGLVRFVRSPAGRVLKSIRDNEQRATALGYKTFNYQILANVFGAVVASLCGVLYALWVRFVGPESVMSTAIMLNILLMLIIGGMGTLYGSIVGAAFILVAESWLADGLRAVKVFLPDLMVLQRLADRWILYFGVLFVLVVIFFPKGLVGSAREIAARRRARVRE